MRCVDQKGDPLGNTLVFLQRPIFRVVGKIKVLELGPSAGLCEFKSLAHQLRPISNGSSQIACVYKIKPFLESPRLFRIVNFEFYVGGNPDSLAYESIQLPSAVPGGLSGAQVGTNDLSLWIVVGHFNGPDARTCSNVKDLGEFPVERCKVERVAHCYAKHLMCKVEAIQFTLKGCVSGDHTYAFRLRTSSFGNT